MAAKSIEKSIANAGATTMRGREKSLKERLGAIMAFKKRWTAAAIVSVALMATALLGSCALGAGNAGPAGNVEPSDPNTPTVATAPAVYVDETYGFSIEFPFEYGDSLKIASTIAESEDVATFDISAPEYGIGQIARIRAFPVNNENPEFSPIGQDEPNVPLGSNNKYQFFFMPATDLPLPGTDDPLFAEASAVFESVRDSMDAGLYEFTLMDVS